jgi:phosphatidylglycerol---prolipoprotein diacylglyceryl transferase
MQQVLFWLPIKTSWTPNGIPIYGFGTMLFIAFIFCTWLYGRRAEKEGVPRERVQDVAIWVFVAGIIGARITYMIVENRPWTEFFQIWQGGIVFYGSAIGGWVGYALAYYFIIRRFNLSTWHLADLIAPCVAAGLCFGRIGCFLNGCCWGAVCDPQRPAAHFPMMTVPAREMLVGRHYQTMAGFTLDESAADRLTIGTVEPRSPAAAAGLRSGDIITRVNGEDVNNYRSLLVKLYDNWPRGEERLILTVARRDNGRTEIVELPSFVPRSRGLHPTQLYESVSMFLLFWVLIFVHPLKPHRGFTFIVFMVGYAVHRYLDEVLRDDTDPVAFGLTLSQNLSLLFLGVAVVLEVYLWRRFRGKPAAVPAPAGKKAG